MTKTTKIVLAIVSVVLLGGAVLVGVGIFFGYKYIQQSTSSDPKQIEQVARKIADYELPVGYKPAFSTDVMGMQMAIFQNQSSGKDQAIIIWQISNSSLIKNKEARKEMEKSIEEGIKKRGFNKDDAVLVEEKPVTIRGKQASLLRYVHKSQESKGNTEQAMVTFEGKGGPATLQIIGPEGSLDKGTVDSFLSSLK
jgi:hypothetical protein